jgi:DNA-binding beta-propeller fold protein YncE
MSIAAAVVVIGVVVAAFTTLHHDGGSGGSGGSGSNLSGGLTTAIQPPGCSTAAASAQSLTQVHSQTVSLGGNPFGVVVTPNGKYSFVSLGDAIAVLNNTGSLAPAQLTTVPAPGAKKDETITSDGKYLLATAGSGAYVISAPRAEAGDGGGAVLGTLAGPPGNPSNEVAVSPDNKFVFITFQNQGDVAVFDLAEAIAGGFGQAGFKGMIQLGSGSDPQAMAVSPDGQWLYVTGESQTGRLFVVDLQKAETDPAHAVQSSAAAGCAPARVITDGTNVWVTDRDSNALVVFSAAKLLSNPAHSLIARVSTGQTPIGLSFINGGNEIMVADANTRGVQGADNLALFSTQLALQDKSSALKGFISTGQVPRELALEPGGKTLLWTDNGSGQLQAIDTGSLP